MTIKDFAVSPYAIAFITALAVSFLIVYLLLLKRGIPSKIIGYSIFLNLIMMIYGAKMYSVIMNGFRVNLLNAGMASLGGVIGLLTGIFIFGFIYKEGCRLIWESYTLVIPLMYGIAKIGCYLVGCCHGISYSGAFAVCYENKVVKGGPYFPVQILESMIFIMIFVVGICFFYARKSIHTVSVIMLMCAVAKFLLEYLREEHIGKILSVNQFICIGFFVWGITMILKRTKKYTKSKSQA